MNVSVYKDALLSLIEQQPTNKFYGSALKAFQKTSEPIARRK